MLAAHWLREVGGVESISHAIYILAHPSRAAAEANWKAFREDPEWIRVKAESETGGTLAPKIESVFLAATDYSPLK